MVYLENLSFNPRGFSIFEGFLFNLILGIKKFNLDYFFVFLGSLDLYLLDNTINN